MIVPIIIGFLLSLVLIIAIARMSDDTKKMKETLYEISNKLDQICTLSVINNNRAVTNSPPQNTHINKTNSGSWMCRCGQTNVDADFCIQCGKPKN